MLSNWMVADTFKLDKKKINQSETTTDSPAKTYIDPKIILDF